MRIHLFKNFYLIIKPSLSPSNIIQIGKLLRRETENKDISVYPPHRISLSTQDKGLLDVSV